MLRDPFIGLIVSSGGAPAPLVLHAVSRMLGGDWPRDRLAIVVSDSAEGPGLNSALAHLRERFPHMVHVGLCGVSDEPASLRDCVDRLEDEPLLAFTQSVLLTVWRDEALEQAGDYSALDLALTAA